MASASSKALAGLGRGSRSSAPPVVLILVGHLPSIKNSRQIVRVGREKRPMIAPKGEYAQAMKVLEAQAASQWRGRGPVEHPELSVWMRVKDRRGDRDNKLAALMDVLVRAGVLVNDNIMRCNGALVIHPAEVVGAGEPEETRVLIEMSGGAE